MKHNETYSRQSLLLCFVNWKYSADTGVHGVISGFRRDVDEISTLLGFYST
jgi:hypothetical protein